MYIDYKLLLNYCSFKMLPTWFIFQ